MSAQLSGVITSLLTPFVTSVSNECGLTTRIDTFRVKVLTRCQAKAGVSAVAVAGWAGEGPTLSDDERCLLIETASQAKASMQVLAHVGSPATARSIKLAREAEAAGADGVILVVPYYNKPNHAGILAHVLAVAKATELPLYIEIDEAATNLRMSVSQIAELTRLEGVAGILDHTANPLHVECMSSAPRSASFFAAHEPTATACGLLGADGIFSAVANVSPARVVELWRAIAANDMPSAREFHSRLLPLIDFAERHGVAGLKYLLHDEIGSEPTVRLPLHELDHAERRDGSAVAAFVQRSKEPLVAAR